MFFLITTACVLVTKTFRSSPNVWHAAFWDRVWVMFSHTVFSVRSYCPLPENFGLVRFVGTLFGELSGRGRRRY